MKKKVLLLIMTIVMAAGMCAGCGASKSVEVKADEVVAPEVEEAEQENEAEPATAEEPAVETAVNTSNVINNGDYFVEIDNKIYFRAYPIGTLEDPLQGTNFSIGSMGEESEIICYDKATGETSVALKDCGQGNINYLNGRFYFENCQGGIYSCLIDGTDVKEFETDETLYIAGCDDETQSLIVRAYNQEGDEKIELWNEGEYLVDLDADAADFYKPNIDYFTIDDDGSLVGYVGDNTITVEGFTENLYNCEYVDMVELQSFIGDCAYVVVNTARDNGEVTEENRRKYTRVETRYLEVNLTTGEVVEMAAMR